MIDGNVTATIQSKVTTKNAIGEQVETWSDCGTVLGWLDYMSGDSGVENFRGRIQETTHIFMCDASRWPEGLPGDLRLVINGAAYTVLLVDNPMGLNQHLEVYLEYVGGDISVS